MLTIRDFIFTFTGLILGIILLKSSQLTDTLTNLKIYKYNEKILVIIGAIGIIGFLYYLDRNNDSLNNNTIIEKASINNNNHDNNPQDSQSENINDSPIISVGGNPNDAVSKKELVLYHASWCPMCSDFMPTWKEYVIKAQKDHPTLKITQIQCEGGNERLCVQKEVPGYPYVTLTVNDDKHIFEDYPRTIDKLENFVNSKI